MNKRKMLIEILAILIMLGVWVSTYFIKIDETRLYEIISIACFPWVVGNIIAKLAIRFSKWLFKPTEE
jgi:hypothetical protein